MRYSRQSALRYAVVLGAIAGPVALLQGCSESNKDGAAPKAAEQIAPAAKPSPPPAAKPETAKATPAEIADKALVAKVKAALDATKGLNALPMDVTARDGEVTLIGTADSEQDRRTAERVAAAVPGVVRVKNALQVVKGS